MSQSVSYGRVLGRASIAHNHNHRGVVVVVVVVVITAFVVIAALPNSKLGAYV